jgi:hypothetical protein
LNFPQKSLLRGSGSGVRSVMLLSMMFAVMPRMMRVMVRADARRRGGNRHSASLRRWKQTERNEENNYCE